MADKDDITREITVRKAVEEGAKGESARERVLEGSFEGARDTAVESVQDIRTRLADRIGELRFVNSALMTCVQALQQQNAEMDADIALVLRRTAGDRPRYRD